MIEENWLVKKKLFKGLDFYKVPQKSERFHKFENSF